MVIDFKKMAVTRDDVQADDSDESDDIEIAAGRSGGDIELIPATRYIAQLAKFKVEPKPEWKIEQQRKYNPDKEPKTTQGGWYFKLWTRPYRGHSLADWQDVSWHEKANGAKYAAALLGKAKLEGNEHTSTKQLVGRFLSIRVTEHNGKNYIDPNGCEPVSLLDLLELTVKEAALTKQELTSEWAALGFGGRKRDDLADDELMQAITRFDEIAASRDMSSIDSLEF